MLSTGDELWIEATLEQGIAAKPQDRNVKFNLDDTRDRAKFIEFVTDLFREGMMFQWKR